MKWSDGEVFQQAYREILNILMIIFQTTLDIIYGRLIDNRQGSAELEKAKIKKTYCTMA